MSENKNQKIFIDTDTGEMIFGYDIAKNINITGYYVNVLKLKQRRSHKKKRINKKWKKKYGYKLVEAYEELDM